MESRKTFFLVAGLVVVAGVIVACGPAFVAPQVSNELYDIARSKWPAATRESLYKGHDLFVASCGKGGFCHKLPTPGSRVVGQWHSIILRMAPKAQLNESQSEAVLHYILAVRDLPPVN